MWLLMTTKTYHLNGYESERLDGAWRYESAPPTVVWTEPGVELWGSA